MWLVPHLGDCFYRARVSVGCKEEEYRRCYKPPVNMTWLDFETLLAVNWAVAVVHIAHPQRS